MRIHRVGFLKKNGRRAPKVLADGYGRDAPLAVQVARKVAWLLSLGTVLPPWDRVVFGESGHGPRALPWDGRYRTSDEFLDRWEQILTATTRDWVNLDVVGVKDGVLVFVVEYLTDDRVVRSWPNSAISVNGGKYAQEEADQTLRRAMTAEQEPTSTPEGTCPTCLDAVRDADSKYDILHAYPGTHEQAIVARARQGHAKQRALGLTCEGDALGSTERGL